LEIYKPIRTYKSIQVNVRAVPDHFAEAPLDPLSFDAEAGAMSPAQI
jgi:hypothetical protein